MKLFKNKIESVETHYRRELMTDACAATTKDGAPCQARPLPGSPFCPFHDPARAAAFAEGRRQGGAASHRRPRRFPRLLDYRHVAELLGELFVDALNNADPADPRALSAVNQLSRTLLQAVGRPKDSHIAYRDREEPTPDQPHLLRVYRPLAPEVAAFAPTEPSTARRLPETDPSDPPDTATPDAPEPDAGPSPAPPAPAPAPELFSDLLGGLPPSEQLDDIVRTLLRNQIPGLNHPELDSWLHAYALVRPWAAPERSFAAMALAASESQAAPQADPQAIPQADNKRPTSDSATKALTVPAPLPPTPSAEPLQLAPSEGAPQEGTPRDARPAPRARHLPRGAPPAARRRR
jgi:hypothetical protein